MPILNFTVLAWFSGGSSSSGFEVSWLVGDGGWAVWRSPVLLGAGDWQVPGLGSGIVGPAEGCETDGKVNFSEQLKYLGSRFCFETGTGVASPTKSSSNSIKG